MLNCLVACGIFLDQGSNLCLLHCHTDSFTTELPGNPWFISYMLLLWNLFSASDDSWSYQHQWILCFHLGYWKHWIAKYISINVILGHTDHLPFHFQTQPAQGLPDLLIVREHHMMADKVQVTNCDRRRWQLPWFSRYPGLRASVVQPEVEKEQMEKVIQNFVNIFSVSISMVIWFFSFILLIWWITLINFQMWTLHIWDQTPLNHHLYILYIFFAYFIYCWD